LGGEERRGAKYGRLDLVEKGGYPLLRERGVFVSHKRRKESGPAKKGAVFFLVEPYFFMRKGSCIK